VTPVAHQVEGIPAATSAVGLTSRGGHAIFSSAALTNTRRVCPTQSMIEVSETASLEQSCRGLGCAQSICLPPRLRASGLRMTLYAASRDCHPSERLGEPPGVPPNSLSSTPKSGGRGLKMSSYRVVGFASALPTLHLHLDSRFRGNDRRSAGGISCRGFGGVPIASLPVIARSGATKQSRGGGKQPEEREIAAPSRGSARRMARNDRFGVCRGAKPLCRGFGGVPQNPPSSPKSGGQGVDDIYSSPYLMLEMRLQVYNER